MKVPRVVSALVLLVVALASLYLLSVALHASYWQLAVGVLGLVYVCFELADMQRKG